MVDKTAPNQSVVIDQIAASVAHAFNAIRNESCVEALNKQLMAFEDALVEMANVDGFLRDPSGQLGNPLTKHGEIAEVVEVGVRRARDLIDEIPMSAHMDGIHRTGPADFVLNGVEAQSKFINGTASGLRAVLGHMESNTAFLNNGGVYVIPSDQYALIERVLRGDTDGMSAKTIRAIEQHIQKIGEHSGRPPLEVLKPSISAYADVQPGNIENTMDRHGQDLEERHEGRNEQIQEAHQASLREGVTATAAAAAAGAAVSFVSAAFKKYREGKNIFAGDYSAQDWLDVGGQSVTGAVAGGLSGAAIYLMTNWGDLSAPLAGAFVSAVKGVLPLVTAYANGEMAGAEFIDAGLFICSDVALVGLSTFVGQTLIPVPVLGAAIGSLAGKILSSLIESQLKGSAQAIRERLAGFLRNLDASQRKLVDTLTARYDALGNLAARAFDTESNVTLLQLSAELAEQHGVPTNLVLRNTADLDDFIGS